MAPEQRRRKEDEDEDRLSQLPSCISLYILSFLSLKDAAKTSALSKYWRRRWLYTDVLDFNTSEMVTRGRLKYAKLSVHTARKVEWVNNVLQAHREATDDEGSSLTLKKLRIHMRLSPRFQNDLDGWLSYAFTRRVQSLELSFLNQPCVISGRFSGETNFSSLRSLSLTRVNITGEVISSFLCNFPFLEWLKVTHSRTLESLTVSGSSLALKFLEISSCLRMHHLTVRDTGLVSLTIDFVGNLSIVNNPKLVVLRTSECRLYRNILATLSGCLSTLQTFAFDTTYLDRNEAIDKVPELSELKQLTLVVEPLYEDSLIRLVTLLSLSPKLEKLVLEFVFLRYEKKMLPSMMGSTLNRSPRFPAQQHIKVIEVRGYNGEVAEDEALRLVLQHVAAPPETVIFDPHNLRRDIYPPLDSTRFYGKKRRVEGLKRVVPSSIDLVVI